MKRTLSKALAFALALALLAGAGLPRALAVTDAQWDAIWEEIDAKQSVVAFTPGSDETQRNFAWQSKSVDDPLEPQVRLSKSAEMSDAVEFRGTIE